MPLLILFGILVGLSLGLTGAGGSILAVPLLVHGAGIGAHEAVRISLLVVALTAAVGAAGALRRRRVSLRAGLIFAATGMLAAPLGVTLGTRIAADTLLAGFALLTLAVSVSMWLRASRHPEQAAVVRAGYLGDESESGPVCRLSEDGQLRLTTPCALVLALCGLGAGLLSGLFGVGGGFLIVPVLMFVTQMGIHRSVATSLLVIALVGGSGAAAGLAQGATADWRLAGTFLLGSIAGMGFGRLLAGRLAGWRLQRIFAVLVFLTGTGMLLAQLAGILGYRD